MRITKLEHAAMLVEQSGRTLVVDPGSLTTPVIGVSGVDAVVITHEHADHWTPDQLQRITAANPEARIIAPAGVAAAASDFPIDVVEAGDAREVGPFRLRFFGGEHAVIHRSIPTIGNVGVLVDERLYYPGDSWAVPEGVTVDTLAVPAAAPWMKLAEAMDYLTEVAPRRAFPTHYGVLSAAGLALSNDRLGATMAAAGGAWFPLAPGETLDV